MLSIIRSLGSLAITWAFCVNLAHAQAVHNISGGTVQTYSEIQPAVDAAGEGDVLLVSEGSYQPFVITGKSVSVFAMPDATVTVAQPSSLQNYSIEVEALGPDQRVVLSGFRAEYDWSSSWASKPLLGVNQNEGQVYLQDCEFDNDGDDQFEPTCIYPEGWVAAKIVDSSRVSLINCNIQGGGGAYGDGWCSDNYPGLASDGGPGLCCIRSTVAIEGGSLVGGDGGWGGWVTAGIGGAGLVLEHSEVFCLDVNITGGRTGSGFSGYPAGPGHSAVELGSASVLHFIDSRIAGGWGSPTGPQFSGPGVTSSIGGVARTIELPVITSWTNPGLVRFRGASHDRFWILSSLDPTFRFLIPMGVQQLAIPLPLPTQSGIAPASGSLWLPLDFAALMTSAAPGPIAVQGLASGNGKRRLSGARHVLALDPASGPDCNGNGLNDYLDLIRGTSVDGNHNLVPDECPGG